jgi:hypothetical protein
MSVMNPVLLSYLLILAIGCSAETGPRASDGAIDEAASAQLALAPPPRGFQVETKGIMVEPGEDARWCEVIRLPGGPEDTYYVNRIETAMTAHAEDLIVSAAEIGSETDAIMDVGARVPCTRAGEAFGEDLVQVTSTQHLRHDQQYPTSVGQVFYGGQKLAVDYHYVNVGEAALAAKVKLNFHTVDETAVQHVAHTAGFDNLTIYTPPGGYSSHLGQCAVSQNVVVGELVRRTRQRGTDFNVWVAGGSRDGELLWHSTDPDDARIGLDRPLALADGEGFRFECDYHNTTDLELRFGVNAGDERCTLDAIYWLPDERAEARAQGCLLFEVDADGVARK